MSAESAADELYGAPPDEFVERRDAMAKELRKAGDRSGAETTARDYLRRFPAGPYATLARGILRGESLAPRE